MKLSDAMKLLELIADDYEHRAGVERVEGEIVRAISFEDRARQVRKLEKWIKSHEKELLL